MIDNVSREHDAIAHPSDEVADGKVVSNVILQRGVTANAGERILAYHDRRPQAELHAFEQIRYQHSCGHLHGHSDGGEAGEKSCRILAAIHARYHAYLRIKQGRHNLSQITRADFNVAV